MHILVTGGLGFIGSAFVRLILGETDMRVTVLDAITYAANPANVASVSASNRYRFVRGDICDQSLVADVIKNADAVVNFAAESHVDRSILDAQLFVRTNVVGTHTLIDAAREFKLPRFVQVSTDEVYGDISEGRASETDALRPRSPYAASKASADLLALAAFTTHGFPVLITRGANTYGPYQYPEKLIPLFITNLLDEATVPLYGDGGHMRDWLHVEDHARGILAVLTEGTPGEIYNLGVGKETANIEITRRLLDLTNRSFDLHVRFVTDRPGHDRRYAMNCAKVRKLGWEPKIDFERGLRLVVEWYQKNESWWRPIKSGEFRKYYEKQYLLR